MQLLGSPLAEAQVARLAARDDLLARLDRLLDRYVGVEAMALVEVDVLDLQAPERRIDLLGDLGGREPTVLRIVGHRAPDLRREDVRVARAPCEDLPPCALGCAAAIDVRRVEEVDAGLEGRVGARARLVERDAAGVGEPGAERDLGDLEGRRAELAVAHAHTLRLGRLSGPRAPSRTSGPCP